jgi:protein-S-isoprenylcysteine O-methyltransferase Ste14
VRERLNAARAAVTIDSMPAHVYAILAAGWLIWLAPFFLIKRNSGKPEKLDRRARWGIVLEGLAYSLLWQSKFWERPPESWRMALSVFFFVSAGLLSWTGARTLGRQWRIDAGLNPDHELVRSGVYRVVRHPIYTSMLCTLLGTGFMLTPLPLLLLAMLLFTIGTEIRVRIEDGLLASRFGDQFQDYQRSVPAYIPFLK